uniref:Fatty-acid and retinol-binding protein 1 n=1 Tax=Parastrongyloides trichosuri TaxID=131310 RepID=A0A0N4ZDD1_PARTI
MKFIVLFSVLFIAKSFADDTVVQGLMAKINPQLTESLVDFDESIIPKVVPTEIVDTIKSFTEQDKAQLMTAGLLVGIKGKAKKENLTLDDIKSAFSGVSEELVTKLKGLHETLTEKYNKLDDNVKTFFTNYISYLKELYEKIKSGASLASITDDEKRAKAYKLVQDYLALSDDDRNSIGNAFETLKNLVNNEKLLTPLRTLTESSTLEQYKEVSKQIIESFKNGDFNPST